MARLLQQVPSGCCGTLGWAVPERRVLSWALRGALGTTGCSWHQGMLPAPGDAPSTGGCSGLGMLLALGGYRMLGAPWKGSRCPDVATCAQMLPPLPLEHCRIRAPTFTDVSKQLISSDRVTAASLLQPQGDQGLVTGTPATQHPPLYALAPSRDPPGLRVGTDPCKRAVRSPPARCPLGPLACVARAHGRSQAGVLIPHIGFAGRESINSGQETGRRRTLIRLRRAAAPPAGINATCCRK